MSIKQNLQHIKAALPQHVTLIAVTKTHGVDKLKELYATGHRLFGENKVQELVDKYEQLPKDIEWHLIGHLQTNKVKYIAPFVTLIHSVDSLKLLQEIDKQAKKNNRVINCLFQIYIASEDTKFGLSFSEMEALLANEKFKKMENIRIVGLMGMATNTEDNTQIASEFNALAQFYKKHQSNNSSPNFNLSILSMGMTSDYVIAIDNGSNMVRIGSAIFGERNYNSVSLSGG